MSTKALKSQLLAAVAMVLVASIALGSSTYAWFAANTRVTATGMSVTAQSDTVFLEISGAADSTTYSTTGTSNVAAKLYPVAHEDWSAVDDIDAFKLGDSETNNNWYYQYSDKVDDADSNLTPKTYIGALTDYVATTTFSVELNTNSAEDAEAYDLYVSSMTLPDNTGIRVVVAGADGYKEFSASQASIDFDEDDILSDTVTKSAQEITVYIYIDGDDEHVYTNNIAALTGAVSFTLDVSTTDHPTT